MNWSIKLGRIFGIDIKVHLTFLLILVWGAFAYGGSAGPFYGIIVTLALFGLVLLHELGHSVAAMGYGIPVRDITLLPIGGVARLERMPEKPLHELVVALAGPAVNVVLALILLPVILGTAAVQGTTLSLAAMMRPGVAGLLTFLLGANLTLAAFNMIPAFPLDGGRVFRALVGLFTNYQKATQIAATVGRILAVGLGLVAIFSGQIFLALIAVFIFMAGSQEAQAVAARSVLRKALAGQAIADNAVALSPAATVGQAASLLMRNHQPNFAVLDQVSGELVGVASSQSVAQAMQRGLGYHSITEIMQQAASVPRVTLTTNLDEVQEKLSETSSRVAAVYDGLHFRGLISLEDIYRAFRFLARSQRTAPRYVGWDAA